jgi:hypothetical protein
VSNSDRNPSRDARRDHGLDDDDDTIESISRALRRRRRRRHPTLTDRRVPPFPTRPPLRSG